MKTANKEHICILYKNKLNYLEKQPYEGDDDAYMRGWYMIKNNLSFESAGDVCKSKKAINEERNGMIY